jgi:hypothetical protein
MCEEHSTLAMPANFPLPSSKSKGAAKVSGTCWLQSLGCLTEPSAFSCSRGGVTPEQRGDAHPRLHYNSRVGRPSWYQQPPRVSVLQAGHAALSWFEQP